MPRSDGDGFTAGEGEVRSSAVTAPRVAVMVAVPSSVTVGSERVSVVVSVSSLMVTTALSVVTRDSKPPPDAAVTARVSEPGVPE